MIIVEKKIKAIFLDVDGVINNDDTKVYTKDNWFVFVDDYLVERVKKIIDKTNAVVVLSSDWRKGLIREDRKPHLEELEEKLKEFGIDIYGYTPFLEDYMIDGLPYRAPRGAEIHKYLEQHPEIGEFVILDDRFDMDPYKAHVVLTKYYWGLTEKDVKKAIEVLNGKLIESRKGLW